MLIVQVSTQKGNDHITPLFKALYCNAFELQVFYNPDIRVVVKYNTCTWYLYLSTYLSVLDVLEYLVYRNVKVLVLDQKVLGT